MNPSHSSPGPVPDVSSPDLLFAEPNVFFDFATAFGHSYHLSGFTSSIDMYDFFPFGGIILSSVDFAPPPSFFCLTYPLSSGLNSEYSDSAFSRSFSSVLLCFDAMTTSYAYF